MRSTDSITDREQGPWTALWFVAFFSFVIQLWICQFFSFGQSVPMTIDLNPSNLWKLAYHFPPNGEFLVLNWLGNGNLPVALNPMTVALNWTPWFFLTLYAPLMGTLALLAMAAFLREMELSRPAALFGGVLFAWQGDLLPFVFPGHFAYITSWSFFAVAAWSTLRAQRTGRWAYAVMGGAACGMMVELPTATDRGAIASLLIAALYLAPVFFRRNSCNVARNLCQLALCAVVALLISLASLMALFQSQISGVNIGGKPHREEVYKYCVQFSMGPQETLTYFVPGFFGWYSNSVEGPYWGWIGQWPGWEKEHQGTRNLNLAISTTGTTGTALALVGMLMLLPGALLGVAGMSGRSRFFGQVLLVMGMVGLVLSWGDHTPLYRPLFNLPLMDKWRNPLKWLEWTNFALAVLSAFGVQHFLSTLSAGTPEVKSMRRKLAWFCGILMGILVLALIASYPFAIVLAGRLQADGYDPSSIAAVMGTLHTSLKVAGLAMALFCGLIYAVWHPERLRGWVLVNPLLHRFWQSILKPEWLPLTLAVGMAILSVGQLGWVATRFVKPASLDSLTATNPLLDALKNEGNRVRVSVAVDDSYLGFLLLNQFQKDGISSVDISAASRIPDDINAFFKAMGTDRQRFWFLSGVKNVVIPQDWLPQMRREPALAANIDHADGYTLVPTGTPDLPSHAMVGMKDFLAKATFVPAAETFSSDREILKRLADPAWNPRQSVLLPASPGQLAPPQEGTSRGRAATADMVDLKTYTSTEIVIDVHSVKGGYVLINDRYDPDWSVQINGQDAELLRADFIMRAVAVPPGDSTIVMRYATRYHVAGFSFSAYAMNNFSDAVSVLAWVISLLALWRRRDSANVTQVSFSSTQA